MDGPVVIASFRSLDEAIGARTAVENAGIDAELTNEKTLGVNWPYRDVIGGIGLLVPADRAEEATAILHGLWPEGSEPAAPGQENAVPEHCPACGSTEFWRIRRLPFGILAVVVLFIGGHLTDQRDLFGLLIVILVVLLAAAPNRRCTSCGERWWSLWPRPADEDAVEPTDVPCPSCGAPDSEIIDRRRMKAWTLLLNFVLPPLLLLWPFMPRRRCEHCGREWR